MDRSTGTRILTPLLNELASCVMDDFHKYIKLAYAEEDGEAAGGNLRNRVADGYLRIGQDTHLNAILPLADTLRICYSVEPTPFVA